MGRAGLQGESYRFCTIDIKSPEEYDIKVE